MAVAYRTTPLWRTICATRMPSPRIITPTKRGKTSPQEPLEKKRFSASAYASSRATFPSIGR